MLIEFDRMQDDVRPAERQETRRLADGRILSWYEWGPGDGLPVLFCTGAAMSGSLGFGAPHLQELGIRLIAIDRPGLGRSDPHPEKSLSSWVEDVAQLIAFTDLYDVQAVGFSQGAPFAFALAARDVIAALAIVSGQDDLAHPSIAPLLHPDVAGLIHAIRQDPCGFEESFARVATQEALWQLIIGMSSERDRTYYLSPQFSDAYQQCLREGFANGARPYVRDLVDALSPWPFELEQIHVPVDLWYGGADAIECCII